MAEIYDEVMGEALEVQEEITPEKGVFLFMNEPEEFTEIFESEGE